MPMQTLLSPHPTASGAAGPSRRPSLSEVCNDLLHYLTALRRRVGAIDQGDQEESGERRPPLTLQGVRTQIKALLARQEKTAAAHAELYSLYKHRAEQILIYLVDQIIHNSGWDQAGSWKDLELELYGTQDGGHAFFQLLRDPQYGDPELRPIFFYALAMGFQGELESDPYRLVGLRQQLYLQLPREHEAKDGRLRLTPFAGYPGEGPSPRRWPKVRAVQLALILTGVAAAMFYLAHFSYSTMVGDISADARQIVSKVAPHRER